MSPYTESGGVVWRDFGGSVTIQCRSPDPDQEFLTLKRGLGEDHVLVIENDTSKNTISKEFTGRLQLHGVFPSVDILIRNLTSGDTGPYWCFYSKFDLKSSQSVSKKGSGSVLLVVAGESQFTYYLTKPSVLTIQLHHHSTRQKFLLNASLIMIHTASMHCSSRQLMYCTLISINRLSVTSSGVFHTTAKSQARNLY